MNHEKELNQAVKTTAFAVRCAGCRILFASASAATVFCRLCWEMQVADGLPRLYPDVGGSSVPTDTRFVFVLTGKLEAAATETATAEALKAETVAEALEAEALKSEALKAQEAGPEAGFAEKLVRGLGDMRWLLAAVLAVACVIAFSFALSAGAAYLQGWDQ